MLTSKVGLLKTIPSHWCVKMTQRVFETLLLRLCLNFLRQAHSSKDLPKGREMVAGRVLTSVQLSQTPRIVGPAITTFATHAAKEERWGTDDVRRVHEWDSSFWSVGGGRIVSLGNCSVPAMGGRVGAWRIVCVNNSKACILSWPVFVRFITNSNILWNLLDGFITLALHHLNTSTHLHLHQLLRFNLWF